MQSAIQLNPAQTLDFLLNVAVVRPVFMWGPPGIGKSALVRRFADTVGLECVSLLGSQLAPEDLLGIFENRRRLLALLSASQHRAPSALCAVSRRAQRLLA
jgi:MoxR-like ATPase